VNAGNVITIALDGSTGSTFYQHHEFMSGQNIWKLVPKEDKFPEFNHIIALFILPSIRKAVKGYSYNLGLTKTRLLGVRILMPMIDGAVDVGYIYKYMSKLRNFTTIVEIPNKRL
jgi:hypothetical protein